MTSALRPLAVGALALAAAAAASAASRAAGRRVELVLENAERGRTIRVPLRSGEVFSVVYQHSLTEEPVTEDFVIDGRGRIVLEAVESPSAAVREYFGLTGPGERHEVVRPMREIVFRVAEGTVQRLRAGGRERSFLEVGERGDRIVMRAVARGAERGRP